MTEWKTYKLGDLGEFFGGVTSIKKEDYGHGTPFLPYKNVYKNSKVDVNELELMNVRPLDLERRNAVYGDIFFTASSETPDEVAMSSVLLDEVENLTYNGFCKRFRLNDFETLLPEYARYLFRDISFRNEVYQMATGDIRFNISQASLAEIEIQIPDLATQKEIAQILTSLDDKIELNLQMNQTLEAMAQAVFKEWFVEFNYPSELGCVGLKDDRILDDKEIQKSTHPKNHNSDNLPKGWKMGKLGDVSILYAGGDKPKEVSEQENEEFNIPIYSNGISNEGLYGFTNNSKIKEESITVSARGTIGYVCLRLKPYVPIVRLIAVVPNTKLVTAKYLYFWLKNQNIRGTGTTQQQLTIPDFSRFTILIPDSKTIVLFTKIADAIFNKIRSNKIQIKILTQTRDALLPKLMSGEISV